MHLFWLLLWEAVVVGGGVCVCVYAKLPPFMEKFDGLVLQCGGIPRSHTACKSCHF